VPCFPRSRVTVCNLPDFARGLAAALALALGLRAVSATPPAPPVATIFTNIPIMDKGYAVIGRDDGLSLLMGTNCCFFFGDTVLSQPNYLGSSWVVNTMYHTGNTNGNLGVSGGYNFKTTGVPPIQFIPYTPDETNWNATNAGHYTLGIWPYGQFYSPADGNQYLTIGKVIETAALTGFGIGLVICPTNPIGTNATRVLSRPGNSQPYLLWDESQGEWGDMCATMSNFVYAYWVNGTNYGNVYVARASLLGSPPAFLSPTNWMYWNGSDWATNNPSAAASLLSGAGIGTIDWNAYLTNGAGARGCYLFTYMSWVANEIYTRASTDLVHWSDPTLQYTIPVSWPSGSFPYFARAAKCLEQNNGQTVFVSWSLPDTNIAKPENIPMIRAQFPMVGPTFSGLPASQSISYGTSNVTLSGTVSASGAYPASGETITVTLNGSATNTTVSDSTGDFSINYNCATLPATTTAYTVTYSYAGDGALYGVTNSGTTLTVNPAPLSIQANAQTKTYGQTIDFGSGSTQFSSMGLQNGETIGSVTLAVSGGGGVASAPVSGSPYTITPSAATGGSFSPANYAVRYSTGLLTVNPLPVVLAGTRPYDVTTSAAFGILSVTNAVGGDDVGVASGSATLAGASVGLEPITSVGSLTLHGGAACNYTLTGASGSVVITNPYLPFAISSANIDVTRTNFVLVWQSTPGVVYKVMASTDLATWTQVGTPILATGTSTTNLVSMSNHPAGAFFQVIEQ